MVVADTHLHPIAIAVSAAVEAHVEFQSARSIEVCNPSDYTFHHVASCY